MSTENRLARWRRIGGALMLLAFVLPAWATDYYVSPAGFDNTGNGSSGAPYREIRKALTVVVAGDRILVADGQYLGFDVAGKNGTSGSPITIKAQGAAAQVNPTSDRADNRDTIFIDSSSYIVIDGLRSFTANRAAIRIEGSPCVTVRNCVVGNNLTWGIFTGHCDDLLIENNEAYGSVQQHGIYVGNSGDRPVVRGNRIHDNSGCGLHMNADLSCGGDGIITGALVENNVITNNGVSGGSSINCDGVQDSTIRNNVISSAHAGGITLFQQDGAAPSKRDLVVNNIVDMANDGRWALQVHSGSSDCVAFNNIFVTHHAWRGSIHIDGAASLAGFVSDYNIFTTNADAVTIDDDASYLNLAGWKATGRDSHSLADTQANLFVNWAAPDFHAKAGAISINAGAALFAGKGSPTQDCEGNSRPWGGAYDMGAYEAQSGAVVPPDTTPPATPAVPTVTGSGASPTLAGTTEAGATVTIYDRGLAVGIALADGVGHWSWTPSTPLAAGTHTFTVVATDPSGNPSVASPPVSVTVSVPPSGAGGGGSSSGKHCGLGSAVALILLAFGFALRRR